MKTKNVLFWLTTGYIAGNLISSAYNKKTGNKYKKDLLESENSFKYALDNFLEVQKSVFADIKDEITSEKNMKIYEKYKENILDIFEEYKDKSFVFVEELKEKGVSYLEITTKKLKNLYEKELKNLDNIKGLSKEKAEELKNKLTKSFKETKDKLKNIKK